MAVLTADHYITGTEQFRRVLETACSATKDGHLVPLGIKPASPPTGFGCIQQGECLDLVNDFPIFRVERFTEKPALDAARQMMTSGEYSWNSGMFVWRVDRILEEIQIRMPDLYARLMEVEAALGRADYRTILLRAWNKVAEQTIDFGVMEHAEDVAVIPVDIGWTDVENWASLAELFSPDEDGNIFVGPHNEIDTHNAFVFGGKRLVAAIGVQDIVIVDSEDALLVCAKRREQEVREIIERLKRSGNSQWL